jgi:hypothetical protein
MRSIRSIPHIYRPEGASPAQAEGRLKTGNHVVCFVTNVAVRTILLQVGSVVPAYGAAAEPQEVETAERQTAAEIEANRP